MLCSFQVSTAFSSDSRSAFVMFTFSFSVLSSDARRPELRVRCHWA
jgi:hypothetical protein